MTRSNRIVAPALLAGFSLSVWSGLAAAAGPSDLDRVQADLREGRYAAAEAGSRALLAETERRDGPDSLATADALDLLVESLQMSGRYMGPEPRACGERAVSIRKRHLDPLDPALARSLRHLGDLLFLRAEYADSRDAYVWALAIYEKSPGADHLEYAETLAGLARLTWQWECDYATAGELFERAVRVGSEGSGTADVRRATILAWQGEYLWKSGKRYEEAERAQRDVLELREKLLGEMHPATAESRMGLADVLTTVGRYEEALVLQERALTVLENTIGSSHPFYAVAQVKYGLTTWMGKSDLEASFELYRSAARTLEAALGPDHPLLAYALNFLASAMKFQGNLAASRSLYERALVIRETSLGPAHRETAMSINNLGLCLQFLGEYGQAEELFLRAGEIWARTLDPGHMFNAAAWVNLGAVRRRMGDYEGAREPLERGLAGVVKAVGEDYYAVAETLYELGMLTWESGGDLSEARHHLERSVSTYEKTVGPDHPDALDARFALAELIATDTAGLKDALVLHRQVLAGRESFGNDHPKVAPSLLAIARLAALGNDRVVAMDSALRAEAISRDHLRIASSLSSEREAIRFLARRISGLDLVLTLAARGGPDAARVLDAVIRSRALVLDEMARRHRTVGVLVDPEAVRLAADLGNARERLARLLFAGGAGASLERYRELLDRTRSEKERLERALAAESAVFRREQEQLQIGLDQVAAALPVGSALVAYVRYRELDETGRNGEPAYLAMGLREGESRPRVVRLDSAEKIDELVANWQREVSSPPSVVQSRGKIPESAYRESGSWLRQAIWDPLVDSLDGVDRVFVVPDGSLHLVSLASLPTGPGQYLLEDGPALHLLSTERDLVIAGDPSTGQGLLIAGGADFDAPPGQPPEIVRPARSDDTLARAEIPVPTVYRGDHSGCARFEALRFDPLPGARKEALEIASLWDRGTPSDSEPGPRPSLVLTGSRAHEATIKRQAPGRRNLHLATHGFFMGERCPGLVQGRRAIGGVVSLDEAPAPVVPVESPLLLSGLVFAGANNRAKAGEDHEDGILTAEEIASLDLSDVELAVLSGCGTGAGEIAAGEGVLGLRRAFRIAGARSLVMSLWSVEDETVRPWMLELYAARLEGLSTAAAVRRASLRTLEERRESGRSTHPFYWGAFVAEGD